MNGADIVEGQTYFTVRPGESIPRVLRAVRRRDSGYWQCHILLSVNPDQWTEAVVPPSRIYKTGDGAARFCRRIKR